MYRPQTWPYLSLSLSLSLAPYNPLNMQTRLLGSSAIALMEFKFLCSMINMWRSVFVVPSTLQQWRFVGFKEEVLKRIALSFFVEAAKKIALAFFTCLLALGGALVGTVIGAVKGHSPGLGAIAGAATAIQLLDHAADDQTHSISKVALMVSLMDSRSLMNWAINLSESMYREISYPDDESSEEGMSMESVQKLPVCEYDHTNFSNSLSCSICLQDFEDGEFSRGLPNCSHFFHVGCIDQWLYLHGSCPICRKFCF